MLYFFAEEFKSALESPLKYYAISARHPFVHRYSIPRLSCGQRSLKLCLLQSSSTFRDSDIL